MIQGLVEEQLGSAEYTSGNEHAYHCPKCNWKNPRLMVNYEEDKFHCWYCGWGGQSTIGILYEIGVDNSIILEAKRELGVYSKISKNDGTISTLDKVKNILHNQNHEVDSSGKVFYIPKRFSNLYENRKKFKVAYTYLRRHRGLSQKEIKLYNFQYDPDQRAILIPSYHTDGGINYYVVKELDGGYDNLEESKFNAIFFESYINFDDDVILTEGTFDATKIGYNTIPLLGQQVSPLLKYKLNMHRPKSITVYLDKNALYKSFRICEDLFNDGHCVYLAHNNEYGDPNETPRSEILKTLENRKEFTLKFIIEWKNQNLYEMFSF